MNSLRQRASFQEAKQRLCKMGVQYGMLFPAKLRIMTAAGTQFFNTVDEIWGWIDKQQSGETNHILEKRHLNRKGKYNLSNSIRRTSPSPLEILNDRQKAMEAASSLSCSEQGSPKQSQDDIDQSESEQESEYSLASDKRGPDVTPGTSDNII
ncbi:hypothetical protein NDU88_007234 [Pleurodeles waltl]|uniref:Uncharacterized protein n=1 Tax=Pleurodeles waltl TaxID=8319 RepID=A0AAV7PKP6_PLEWA|nr:hypothetical protein NDU88_007234 [Pleurodeles waltl]